LSQTYIHTHHTYTKQQCRQKSSNLKRRDVYITNITECFL
jgi:hypothetical protein